MRNEIGMYRSHRISLNHLKERFHRWLSVPMRNEIGMYRSHRISLNHLKERFHRWLSVPMRNEIGMYRSHRVSKPVISIRFSLRRVVIDRYLCHVKITQSPLGTFSQVAECPDEERNRDVSKPPGITQSPLGTFSQVAEYPDEERNRDVSKPRVSLNHLS
jgi:hypothetical protein